MQTGLRDKILVGTEIRDRLSLRPGRVCSVSSNWVQVEWTDDGEVATYRKSHPAILNLEVATVTEGWIPLVSVGDFHYRRVAPRIEEEGPGTKVHSPFKHHANIGQAVQQGANKKAQRWDCAKDPAELGLKGKKAKAYQQYCKGVASDNEGQVIKVDTSKVGDLSKDEYNKLYRACTAAARATGEYTGVNCYPLWKKAGFPGKEKGGEPGGKEPEASKEKVPEAPKEKEVPPPLPGFAWTPPSGFIPAAKAADLEAGKTVEIPKPKKFPVTISAATRAKVAEVWKDFVKDTQFPKGITPASAAGWFKTNLVSASTGLAYGDSSMSEEDIKSIFGDKIKEYYAAFSEKHGISISSGMLTYLTNVFASKYAKAKKEKEAAKKAAEAPSEKEKGSGSTLRGAPSEKEKEAEITPRGTPAESTPRGAPSEEERDAAVSEILKDPKKYLSRAETLRRDLVSKDPEDITLSTEDVELLNAVSLFTGHNVKTVRDPDRWNASLAHPPHAGNLEMKFDYTRGRVFATGNSKAAYTRSGKVLRKLGSSPFPSSTLLRESSDFDSQLKGVCPGKDTEVAAALSTVKGQRVCRGMSLPRELVDKLESGHQFDMDLSSWSSAPSVASSFSYTGATGGKIRTIWAGPATTGIPLGRLSQYPSESEIIRNGKVKVTHNIQISPSLTLLIVE